MTRAEQKLAIAVRALTIAELHMRYAYELQPWAVKLRIASSVDKIVDATKVLQREVAP